jgi:hypothetical protein
VRLLVGPVGACGCRMPLLSAGAGSRPGGRGTFLCVAKETYPKERRPRCPCPPRPGARGQPAMLGPAVCRRTRCVLRTPLRQLRQARQRCACPSARAHPRPCASRHGQKGVGTGPTRAIASLGLWSFAALGSPGRSRQLRRQRAARNRPQAQLRSSSRFDPAPHPFWLRREAQELGWACVPKDTHASSSSLPQLSERSSKNAASSSTPPQIRASQVARSEAKGRRLGVAFSWPTFFWRRKRRWVRRRAHIPASALCNGMR